jgi:outer membrane lipoprotein SlyB
MLSRITLFMLLGAAVLAGCARPSTQPDVYSRGTAQTPYRVLSGEVVSVERVRIEGEASQIGRLGGAVIGYEAARSASDTGLAGAIGGVAGAVAGEAVEKAVTSTDGLRITVRLDNGDLIAIVQGDAVTFSPGEAVYVHRRGNVEARVIRRPGG